MLWAILGSVLIAFGLIALVITQNVLLILVQLIPGVALLAIAAFTSAQDIRSRLAQDSSRRSLFFGGNALVQTVALVAVLALFSYWVKRHPHEWDWTEGGVHSLARATQDILGRIPEDQPVEVYAFFSDPGSVRETLDRYAYESKRFSYKVINPNREPGKAQLFEINQDQTLVVCRGPCETASGDKAAMTSRVTEPTEEKITQSVRSVISSKRKVYFTQGHEEGDPNDDSPQGMALAKKALEGDNVEVATVSLATSPVVPKDADALVVAGPARPLLDTEVKAIDAYVRGGGAVLLMIDPLVDTTELDPTLQSWGIKMQKDVIVDEQLQLFGAPQLSLQPVTMQYGDHPITREMTRRLTMYRLARSVEPVEPTSTEVTKLIDTSESSWAASDVSRLAERGEVRLQPDKDRRGPISIAVARTFKPEVAAPANPHEAKPDAKAGEDASKPAKTREGRLVVVGDADFARNQLLAREYNADLVTNMASWLVGQEEFITIDRKLPRASSVEMSLDQVYNFSYLAIFLLPESLVVLGVLQWWRRRS